MGTHFIATTEGSLPITAVLYGFKLSDPLVLNAKNDLALKRDVHPVFFHVFQML